MIIKDTFSKFTNISKLSGCIAFFTNEKSEITHLKKYFNSSNYKNLTVLLKNKNNTILSRKQRTPDRTSTQAQKKLTSRRIQNYQYDKWKDLCW